MNIQIAFQATKKSKGVGPVVNIQIAFQATKKIQGGQTRRVTNDGSAREVT